MNKTRRDKLISIGSIGQPVYTLTNKEQSGTLYIYPTTIVWRPNDKSLPTHSFLITEFSSSTIVPCRDGDIFTLYFIRKTWIAVNEHYLRLSLSKINKRAEILCYIEKRKKELAENDTFPTINKKKEFTKQKKAGL